MGLKRGQRRRRERALPQKIEVKEWDIPTPEQAAKRMGNIARFANLVFEVELGGSWRQVRITDRIAHRIEDKPELTFLEFALAPTVPTPYLSEIRGVFFLTLGTLKTGYVSWVPDGTMNYMNPKDAVQRPGASIRTGFRPTNQEAADWLVRYLYSRGGAKYRSKKLIRKDQYEYTVEP